MLRQEMDCKRVQNEDYKKTDASFFNFYNSFFFFKLFNLLFN